MITRNVRALIKIDPEIKITLFGKLSDDYEDFIKKGNTDLAIYEYLKDISKSRYYDTNLIQIKYKKLKNLLNNIKKLQNIIMIIYHNP